MSCAESLKVLEAQVRQCFGRVVYTHKTHSKEADSCAKTLRDFKLAQIVLSGITASGAVSTIFSDEYGIKIVTAIIAILSVTVSSYMKGFDPGATAQKHRDAAADIWPLRESYLSLLADIGAGVVAVDEIRQRRDELQEQLAPIYRGAPHTTSKAFADAQEALKLNEEYTFSDEELDQFLPFQLRRAKPQNGDVSRGS